MPQAIGVTHTTTQIRNGVRICRVVMICRIDACEELCEVRISLVIKFETQLSQRIRTDSFWRDFALSRSHFPNFWIWVVALNDSTNHSFFSNFDLTFLFIDLKWLLYFSILLSFCHIIRIWLDNLTFNFWLYHFFEAHIHISWFFDWLHLILELFSSKLNSIFKPIHLISINLIHMSLQDFYFHQDHLNF